MMVDTSEIVTKLIITFLVIYIAIKFIGPSLQLFWEQLFHHPKKSNVDIDILIERQKQILRNGLAKEESPSPKLQHSTTNKTINAYQDRFQKLLSHEPKDQNAIDDIKKIFSLFDSLQWGEAPPFTHITKNIEKEFDVSIEQFKITAILKKFIENDFLLSRKGGALPSHQEIIGLLELAAMIDKFFDESISQERPYLQALSRLWKIPLDDIAKGLVLSFQKEEVIDMEMKKNVLNNKMQMDKENKDNIFQILKFDDNKFFQSKKAFLQMLKSHSEFFFTLSPLQAPKDKKDIQGARKIFHIDEKASLEDIKATYKRLAAKKHPDKLSAYGIPPEFEPIATKNFSIIQQSYDIILNEYETK